MKPHIFMLRENYDVTLITNATEQEMAPLLGEHTRFIKLNLQRKIALWQDISCLLHLYAIFRREHFDAVQSLMPKSGLLTMIAAFAAGVPHRVHFFTGQVWANKTGIARAVLKFFDKAIALGSTSLLTDGLPQKDFLVAEKIVAENKISILGNGSICGVDCDRFKPDQAARARMREELGIPSSAIVFIFIGRLNRDKGILDLARAFISATARLHGAHLLIVGPDEENVVSKLKDMTLEIASCVHYVGATDCPEKYMAVADVICLPSYREGFGSVIIEAAAVGLPAVVSDIYGLRDSISAGETGLYHAVGNVDAIEKALVKLATDDSLRKEMSEKARIRVCQYFSTEVIVAAMREYYCKLLGNQNPNVSSK
ncbi:MAG: glycosyltransferase [Bdellovibrionales bacterium]